MRMQLVLDRPELAPCLSEVGTANMFTVLGLDCWTLAVPILRVE